MLFLMKACSPLLQNMPQHQRHIQLRMIQAFQLWTSYLSAARFHPNNITIMIQFHQVLQYHMPSTIPLPGLPCCSLHKMDHPHLPLYHYHHNQVLHPQSPWLATTHHPLYFATPRLPSPSIT